MLFYLTYFLAPTTSFERKGFCTFRLKWGCSGTTTVPQQPIFSRKLQNRFLSEGILYEEVLRPWDTEPEDHGRRELLLLYLTLLKVRKS